MTADDTTTTDTAAVDDAASDGEFASGFAGIEGKADKVDRSDKADTKPPANGKAEPARDASRAEAEPPPEVVQITAREWAEVRAAAAKTASYDQQLSKAFGTIGNLQKLVNGFQTQQAQDKPPPARKVEISPAAFAEMAKDFPELAQQTRAALEAALSGYAPNGADAVDATKIEGMLASYTARREIEALEDAFPEWRTIVGAVDITKEQPDGANPFRKWLAGKDEAYQQRINGSESAAVIGRAIRLFQRETATTAAPAKPNGANGTPAAAVRADRIRAAVQPRGDNAGAPAGKSDDDEFAEGFRTARG
jgi:hypothetical protein